MIRILAVGKKHEIWIEAGLKRYSKRLRAPWDIKWQLLSHSTKPTDQARSEESERLAKQLSTDDYVVLLDETGDQLDSPALTDIFERRFTNSQNIVLVIGGACGVDQNLKNRSDKIISLSKLVFPHQLVRLLLVEQVYRCQEIARGGSYHHE